RATRTGRPHGACPGCRTGRPRTGPRAFPTGRPRTAYPRFGAGTPSSGTPGAAGVSGAARRGRGRPRPATPLTPAPPHRSRGSGRRPPARVRGRTTWPPSTRTTTSSHRARLPPATARPRRHGRARGPRICTPPTPTPTRTPRSRSGPTPPPAPRQAGTTHPTGEPAPAKGAKGRAFTGIAAAAITTVLAVVVAGQVTDDGDASGARSQSAADGQRDIREPASRGDDRETPAGAPEARPLTYEEKMGATYALKPDLAGPGKFDAIRGIAEAPGKGRKITYRVDVEQGLDLDGELFAEAVQKTLNDERSWAH